MILSRLLIPGTPEIEGPAEEIGTGLYRLADGVVVSNEMETTKTFICGWPRSGKTTLGNHLAERAGTVSLHTDDIMGLGWSEASAEAAKWIDKPAPLFIEGMAVLRALRKWLVAHPGESMVGSTVIHLQRTFLTLSPGQAAMGKGADTVLNEIHGELAKRGAIIDIRGSNSGSGLESKSEPVKTNDVAGILGQAFDEGMKSSEGPVAYRSER